MQSSYQSIGISRSLQEGTDYKLSFFKEIALAFASGPSTSTHWWILVVSIEFYRTRCILRELRILSGTCAEMENAGYEKTYPSLGSFPTCTSDSCFKLGLSITQSFLVETSLFSYE